MALVCALLLPSPPPKTSVAWRGPGMEEPGGLPSMGSQSWSRLKRFSSRPMKHTPANLKCSIRQASLSITNTRSSLRHTSIKSVMPSSHLIFCPPFSSCPQSLPTSESLPMSQSFACRALAAQMLAPKPCSSAKHLSALCSHAAGTRLCRHPCDGRKALLFPSHRGMCVPWQ